MKILVFGAEQIKIMPYINLYLQNIDAEQNELHVVYWNRANQQEDLSAYKNIIWHKFCKEQKIGISKFKKLFDYLLFRKFTLKVMKKEKFDFVISLHTPTIIIADKLLLNYKNNYIFDYRDYIWQKVPLSKTITKSLVKNSHITFISSNGFRRLFPQSLQDKLITTHNVLIKSLDYEKPNELICQKQSKIKIGFWGLVRNYEINKDIIQQVSKDDRFELHFYGRKVKIVEKLIDYAKTIEAKNIFFHGEYQETDRYSFAKDIDIAHNLFDDYNSSIAMTNKYYDSVIFKIPQIVIKNTQMAKCVEQYGIGHLVSKVDENFTNELYDYYNALDKNKFIQNCKTAQSSFMKEYDAGVKYIQKIFNKEGN